MPRPISTWTPERTEEFRLLYPLLSQKELAAHFNVTLKSVKSMAGNTGIKKQVRGWTHTQDKYLLAHYNDSALADLSERFGKQRCAVSRRYKKLME